MDQNQNRAPVSPGQVLAGKYRVERVLGVGGMGVVVAAHHLYLNERVALKFLLPEVAKNADIIARFSREAQAAVKIKSEHVARVSDVGSLENGSPYMVMEFLEGKDLESVLQARGPMPVAEAVEYVLQASEALAEAHSLGIVHRDLKPANLFLAQRADGSPLVKVLDFGISKLTGGAESQSMTRTTASMGSPLYMAPEQIRSAKNVDARVDLWALGVILFELLAGRPPFMADSVPSLYVVIATEPPLSLRSVRPEIPAALEQVVYRCLEKDPARRFADVGELALALSAFGPAHASMSVSRVQRTLRRSGADGGRGSLPSISGAEGTGQGSLPGVSGVSGAVSSGDPRRTSGAAGSATGPAMTSGEWTRSNAPKTSRGPRVGIVAAAALATLALGAGGAALALRGGSTEATGQATAEPPAASPSVGDGAGETEHAAAKELPEAPVAPASAAATAGAGILEAPPSAAPSASAEAKPAVSTPRPSAKPTVVKSQPKPTPKPTAAPKPSSSPFVDLRK